MAGMKRISLFILVLIISIHWVMAQVDNLKMSDLREINYQVVKLIGDYESYSALSGTEDNEGFIKLFAAPDALVYCDILTDVSTDEKVGLNNYIDIVKRHYSDVNTFVKINKINLPSFKGTIGTVEVEIAKTVSGINKCQVNIKELFILIATVKFKVNSGNYENFKISDIRSKTPRGKLIVLKSLGPKGKVLPNESFIINSKTYSSDLNGIIKYHLMNKDSSLAITPLNTEYSGTILFKDYKDILANTKKGITPCEQSVVEFSVQKPTALALKTTTIKKETKKEKLDNESYEKTIAEAQILLTGKKYQEAKALYQSALKIKPTDEFALKKISEIENSLNKIKIRNESYSKAVAEGDSNYKAARYREALAPYQLANSLKPEENYPLEQIDRINGIFASVKKKESTYASKIEEADSLLTNKAYSEAKVSYQTALKIKPDEKYPLQKISEIDMILAGIKTGDDKYSKEVAEGDNYYKTGKYQEAIEPYKRARKLKPGEKYPLAQIDKINLILTDLKKKDSNYASEIAKADKLLADKKYSDAISSYSKASAIKPDEKYPKEKIIAIKIMLTGGTVVKSEYAQAISEGNIQLAAKEFEKALASFRTAQQLKPQELLPKEKIAQTEAEMKKLNDLYASAIAEGDNKFMAKQYQPALESYNKALDIKSGEKYPEDKIREINEILSQNKVTQEQYDQALADGDISFAAKDYEKAISDYKKASQLRQDEQLPKDKIAQAEAEIKKINKSYLTWISEADKKYKSKKYPEAIEAYNKAADIKPEKNYPRDQITLINELLAKEKTVEFPVGLVLNYILPSSSGPIANKTDLVKYDITPSVSLGYGVTAGCKFKLGSLGKFQVNTGFTLNNINYSSGLSQYKSYNTEAVDMDNYNYTRIIQINNLKEDIKLSYFSIPLGLEKIFPLWESGWALSLNAGINFMFLSSATNESSANISYAGYYAPPLNVTIYETGVYDFGNFAVATSNSIEAKSSLMNIDFGAKLSKRIGHISIFAQFRHSMSNNDLFVKKDSWSLSEKFLELESTMNFKNNYNLRYNYLALGLVYNL
jgi:tetratricopeptide (TPR) repeat protein